MLRAEKNEKRAYKAAVLLALLVTLALGFIFSIIEEPITRSIGLKIYLSAGGMIILIMLRLHTNAIKRHDIVVRRLNNEIQASHDLCMEVIETLAFAVEARTSCNIGHLGHVQALSIATARAMGLSAKIVEGVRVASLVHEIGRLGVPDNLLSKQGQLTDEEREKVRAYPVLGGRLLSAIHFPWPVAAIVRHHREHFDGTGYPDGLFGEAIPEGSRILAVADAYGALVGERGYREGIDHLGALDRVRERSGTHFDPHVVEAFISVVDGVNSRLNNEGENQASSAAWEITRAQLEVQTLYELACSVGATLCLDDTLDILAHKIRAIIHCSTCVIFLHDPQSEWLEAYSVYGLNQPYFLNSRARVGTYFTGRVVSRGEPILTAYLEDDILFSETSEPWRTLRSTLIVPLVADGDVIGVINLYHEEPNAFQADDLRVMSFVGELAGKAVNNARLFEETQETAFTDALTGIRNARYLRHFLDQEINRAKKNHHQMAVMVMDLDHFKPINDNYGHEKGDEILSHVAKIFVEQVRNYDLVARYAGDEFVVILPETDRISAEIVHEKMMAAIDAYSKKLHDLDPGFPQLGVSIGTAIYPQDAEDRRKLLDAADRMMYDNKRIRHNTQRAA